MEKKIKNEIDLFVLQFSHIFASFFSVLTPVSMQLPITHNFMWLYFPFQCKLALFNSKKQK